MTSLLQRVHYKQLNSRQKESHNFQKVSAVLADYGFTTIRLTDDWCGADFIAQHMDGVTFLKVQLKARLTIDYKYQQRGIHVCFRSGVQWYLYPHDSMMERLLASQNVANTDSWTIRRAYSFRHLSKQMLEILEPFRLQTGDQTPETAGH